MKIQEVMAFGLRGRAPEGGWSNELQPGDCVQPQKGQRETPSEDTFWPGSGGSITHTIGGIDLPLDALAELSPMDVSTLR